LSGTSRKRLTHRGVKHLRGLRARYRVASVQHEIRDALHGRRCREIAVRGQRFPRLIGVEALLGGDSRQRRAVAEILAALEVRGEQAVDETVEAIGV
jgi:hypothetical protein